MATDPLICVTNDDGIDSPGLLALAEAVFPLGELVVLGPRHQQSGKSRGMWGEPDERLERIDYVVCGKPVEAYRCDCSPAKLVLHAMEALFDGRPISLLMSGINYGENVGYDVTVSGTVGAAFQAAVRGVPAVAVSVQAETRYLFKHGPMEWAAASHFARRAAQLVLERGLPPDADVLNVNVPGEATPNTPWAVTRQARSTYFDAVLTTRSPNSRLGDLRTVVRSEPRGMDPGTDIHAVLSEKAVSITLLSLDLTARTDRSAVNTWLVAR